MSPYTPTSKLLGIEGSIRYFRKKYVLKFDVYLLFYSYHQSFEGLESSYV